MALPASGTSIPGVYQYQVILNANVGVLLGVTAANRIATNTTATFGVDGSSNPTVTINGVTQVMGAEGASQSPTAFTYTNGGNTYILSIGPIAPSNILDVTVGNLTALLGGLGDIGITPGATDFVPCFVSGTMILTDHGEVAVESLAPGDQVISASGEIVAVKWVGYRHVDTSRHPRPWDIMPVRVAAHAFGSGLPTRDLLLSPDHSLFVDGVLIPVRYLLNDATVVQEDVAAVTYWHIELPNHGVMLAEGLPAESYLDTGNRSAFANGETAPWLHPAFALHTWDTEACAPLVVAGPALEAVRNHLFQQAVLLGHKMTNDADLHLMVDGRRVSPEIYGGKYRFDLPFGAARGQLVSRAAVPAHMPDAGGDHRRLGIAVAAVGLDGRPIRMDDPRLDAGWYAAEPGWRWTDGTADLVLAGASVLEVEVAMTARYWQAQPASSGASAA